jgi:hypothetical protein
MIMAVHQGNTFSTGGNIDGGRELAEIESKNPALGSVLRKIISGVNQTALNAGVSPTGQVSAPKAPDSVSVSTAGEMMQVSINHSGAIQRGIHYISEVSTDSAFTNPLVIDHGASRTSHPFPLPTNDSDGTAVNYYVRSYAQHPGGPPSATTTVGGSSSPTAHTMGGSTDMTLQTSHGSGTANNNGQQGGWGLGKTPSRAS